MDELRLSGVPHLHSGVSTRRIMLDVILSLTPAVIAALVIFGAKAFLLICVSVAACTAAEFGFCKIFKRKNTVGDLSCVVTGLLLALIVPVSLSPLLILPGAVIAICLVKMPFGGLGKNYVNPALFSAVVLALIFPGRMTAWTKAFSYLGSADAATTATPLKEISVSNTAELPGLLDLLTGLRGGCVGETCAGALILGGIYLVGRRVISPVIPLVFLGTAAAVSLFSGRNVWVDLFSGGLLLGAVFMATDPVTSPGTTAGMAVYAFCGGLLTMLIRILTPLPEGVGIAILVMNLLARPIDRFVRVRPFGVKSLLRGG
ncbi:MAG: RnfABCDGE type electron transport complex subunit D [Clostridia bacterium]|nr:RnfABCDGE type electron transport complex subunit D [Clostridia bacterium]